MKIARLLLRPTVGILFFGHGTQKLFGWFGGNGLDPTGQAFENNLVLIAVVLALTETGPGKISLDAALGQERSGPGWAIAALLAGTAGAAGAHLLAEAYTAPPAPPAPAQGEPAPAESNTVTA